jgi:coatomer protein complex subunit alpha (xenin)
VALFDVQQRTTVAELATPPIKYAVWSGDMDRVALLRWVGGLWVGVHV